MCETRLFAGVVSMRKTSLVFGVAAYAVLLVPSVMFADESGDLALIWVSFLFCAVITSGVLSAVAFSLAREDMNASERKSRLGLFRLAILALPAFSVATASIAGLIFVGFQLAS